MNEEIVVHKLDEKGNEVWRYSGQLLERSETHIIIEARYDRDDQDFHELLLRRGDRFVESFYSDRWYNVFATSRARPQYRPGTCIMKIWHWIWLCSPMENGKCWTRSSSLRKTCRLKSVNMRSMR